YNRAAVMEHIASRFRDSENEAALGGFALLLLDLDGFKHVNDSLGHDAGDSLLRDVAGRINVALRSSDYCARLGGDEFLIVVPQVSDRETAARVAGKLIETLSEPYRIGEETARVTASI